ncbi:MAG: tRNA lysidine(34) synthetase TilS [Kocuria sp.]|nr:tRNA lysidine(34) synthetase TilS [Kocuria sp.]
MLTALSGGPDSLALAAAAAHFSRRRRWRVGAVIVDHQLQEGSDRVAETAAQQARELGLHPVDIRTVTVHRKGDGLEAAARHVRYRALAESVELHGAHGVLLGHTRDDQAETVLLGLARGSGTRSLAGMAPVSHRHGMQLLRPLLDFTRQDTEAMCAAEQLQPWLDPTNSDESFMRARVRHTILPFLERELGPGVAASLARSAAILGPDADELDRQARDLLVSAREAAAREGHQLPAGHGSLAAEAAHSTVQLSLLSLRCAAVPVMRRALVQACILAGGEPVSYERLEALSQLAAGSGAAGPVQMAGKVSVYRRRPISPPTGHGGLGILEFMPGRALGASSHPSAQGAS